MYAGAAACSCPNLPFTGGLVGIAGYDLVRHFEHARSRRLMVPAIPELRPKRRIVATESLLIFDHLTRRIALLHSGNADERLKRCATPSSGCYAARCRRPAAQCRLLPIRCKACRQEEFKAGGTARSKDYIAQRRYLPDCAVGPLSPASTSLSPFETYRAMRLVNPSPYMFFFRSRRSAGGRFFT